jgi:tRNA threonylcarbamoyl adenosine modification protein YeaZ
LSIPANSVCLALETAVGAGSVAVLRDGLLVAESTRAMRPSRAEELLGVIREVMARANIGMRELSFIAVSTGPGSYSGIRIGISTAIGFKNSLGIECRGVSLLEAIAFSVADSHTEIVAAVPVGKNDIAWQRFESLAGKTHELAKPTLASLPEFQREVENVDPSGIWAPLDVLQRIGLDGSTAADDGRTLAALVGKVAGASRPESTLTPIYLRSGAGF